jgi:hypothetical protein
MVVPPILSDSKFTTSTLFDASVNAGVIQTELMRIRFSIRTLVLAVTVIAVVTFLAAPYFRLSYKESISGWGQVGDHYLIWGETESRFAWGVAFSHTHPITIDAGEVRFDDGTIITANDQSLAFCSLGKTVEVRLNDGDLHLFRGIDDIETIHDISGISIEEYVNCWTFDTSKEPEVTDELTSRINQLLDP